MCTDLFLFHFYISWFQYFLGLWGTGILILFSRLMQATQLVLSNILQSKHTLILFLGSRSAVFVSVVSWFICNQLDFSWLIVQPKDSVWFTIVFVLSYASLRLSPEEPVVHLLLNSDSPGDGYQLHFLGHLCED